MELGFKTRDVRLPNLSSILLIQVQMPAIFLFSYLYLNFIITYAWVDLSITRCIRVFQRNPTKRIPREICKRRFVIGIG